MVTVTCPSIVIVQPVTSAAALMVATVTRPPIHVVQPVASAAALMVATANGHRHRHPSTGHPSTSSSPARRLAATPMVLAHPLHCACMHPLRPHPFVCASSRCDRVYSVPSLVANLDHVAGSFTSHLVWPAAVCSACARLKSP
ncbi:hypothetical protein CF336_g7593 [Tilletia laevis]|nr:hypothetical protein CF336_g7593 [Tilletia laevis]